MSERKIFNLFVTMVVVVGFGIIVFFSFAMNGQTKPEDPLMQREAPTGLRSFSDVFLCKQALNDDKTGWETNPRFVDVIAEAARRGFSVAACRAAVSQAASAAYAQDYQDWIHYPQRYAKRLATFRGKVVQSIENPGKGYTIRVNVTQTRHGWQDTVWVDFTRSLPQRVVEGDIIDVTGRLNGIKTYTAIMGQTIQIPAVLGCEITLITGGPVFVHPPSTYSNCP